MNIKNMYFKITNTPYNLFY